VGIPTSTTPHRNVEHPFNIAELVVAAGANYVSRWTTYHVFPLMESMQNAIRKKGFSFVEIIAQCPVSFGKQVGMRTAQPFLDDFKKNSIRIEKARGMSEEELEGKYVIGKLVERNRAEFTDNLLALNRRVQGEGS
jgi:2-oxoglutarate ferredoxin oxidoreductase subunit beta